MMDSTTKVTLKVYIYYRIDVILVILMTCLLTVKRIKPDFVRQDSINANTSLFSNNLSFNGYIYWKNWIALKPMLKAIL